MVVEFKKRTYGTKIARLLEADLAVGVKAVAAICSTEDGDAIVKTAIDAFGTVHVLVASAGLLRDKSFMEMDESM